MPARRDLPRHKGLLRAMRPVAAGAVVRGAWGCLLMRMCVVSVCVCACSCMCGLCFCMRCGFNACCAPAAPPPALL